MKITNHIELTGPLQRNRSLKNLRRGDLIQVRVLDRIDSRTADLDLLGNRVRAHFKTDVPGNAMLKLRINGNSKGMLVFSLEEKHQGFLSGEHNLLLIPGMERYLSSISGTVPDIFSLIKNFVFHLRVGKERGKSHILQQLLQKFTPSQVSLLSMVISSGRQGNELAMLVYDLLKKHQASSHGKEMEGIVPEILDDLNGDEAAQLVELAVDPDYSRLVVENEGEAIIMEIVTHRETVAVRFELSTSGEIQIVGRKRDDAIDIDMYMEKEYFCTRFDLNRNNIDSKLSAIKGNVTLRTYDLNEIHAQLSRHVFSLEQKDVIDFTV